MSYDVHTPAATRPKRRIARFVIPVASVAFISGAVALPASAAIGHPPRATVGVRTEDSNPNRQPGGGAYGPNTCKPGYVWRDSYDGDTLCVTPGERQRVHDANPNRQPGGGVYGPSTCKQGYVWRDSYDGDTLCVTPEERQRVHDANPNRQPGGGVYGPSTCKQGYVWREKWEGDTQCVTPAERDRAKGSQARTIDDGPNLIGIPGL
ncbi:hypothetical protein Snoj_82370 [Streptomyces nojiriensis]|uniref:Secreted protein n=1 Tax=Streptomyces nojiriensis TaxID=66374 RepID=A0ABQ3T1R1_9ACTN|nr:hypothetical protein [Streptomyces nojiriensis]QTI47811.1 hypothetical protein JYK04_05662 [Streptomyces nojiriensis]GGS39426.1 hypothetical protein GCM10010205_81440 [Streptomyces nojiriensis]GHI74319.1 hypothetical protein Snoj_82370 [Streptomyces nojiriensis]